MDALTWFKSVFRRALTTSDPLRADLDTEMWPDVPLHLAAARLRPRPAPMPPPLPRTSPRTPRANPDLVVWGGGKKAFGDVK
jgi:hypothetical protein